MAKKAARSAKATKAASKGFSGDTLICVICGVEDMLKRQRLAELRDALTQARGEVETINFEAKTAQLADVLDELRGYGLMQQHKLVIVDDADQFAAKHRPALERYAECPVTHATLVLRSTRWNKGKLDKLIEKVGCVVKCDAPSEAVATKWAVERAEAAHHCKLTQRTAAVLVQRVGKDLGRIDAALAKLALTAQPGETIREDRIDEVVGRGSDEHAWAVQEAILKAIATDAAPRETGDAIAKLHELIDLAGQPDVLVGYFAADVVRKLYLARQMLKQGAGQGQIAGDLKIWPRERQQVFFGALRKLDESHTGRLFDTIMHRLWRARRGGGNTTGNLEGFVAELADQVS